ncbi:hypothetical protein HanOQP8_Chr17g0669911 [Helianthus annuus]|nr:hypothetical protein HanOQP8_Chr17g0669911 [Helianthus annuus]
MICRVCVGKVVFKWRMLAEVRRKYCIRLFCCQFSSFGMSSLYLAPLDSHQLLDRNFRFRSTLNASINPMLSLFRQ